MTVADGSVLVNASTNISSAASATRTKCAGSAKFLTNGNSMKMAKKLEYINAARNGAISASVQDPSSTTVTCHLSKISAKTRKRQRLTKLIISMTNSLAMKPEKPTTLHQLCIPIRTPTRISHTEFEVNRSIIVFLMNFSVKTSKIIYFG